MIPSLSLLSVLSGSPIPTYSSHYHAPAVCPTPGPWCWMGPTVRLTPTAWLATQRLPWFQKKWCRRNRSIWWFTCQWAASPLPLKKRASGHLKRAFTRTRMPLISTPAWSSQEPILFSTLFTGRCTADHSPATSILHSFGLLEVYTTILLTFWCTSNIGSCDTKLRLPLSLSYAKRLTKRKTVECSI